MSWCLSCIKLKNESPVSRKVVFVLPWWAVPEKCRYKVGNQYMLWGAGGLGAVGAIGTLNCEVTR